MTFQGVLDFLFLCLPPFFNLTSVILILCGSLAPVPFLHQFALLTVTSPSSPSQEMQPINKSTVWMGLFGSCARSSDSSPINCTKAALFPQYDLSVLDLPTGAPSINSPPVWFTISVIVSISLGFLFLVSVSLLSLYCKSDKVKTFIEKRLVIHLILFLGIISTVFGITAFLLLRLWFANGSRTFNTYTLQQQVSDLKASLGNGFTLIWIGHGLLAPPLFETIFDYRKIRMAVLDEDQSKQYDLEKYGEYSKKSTILITAQELKSGISMPVLT